MEQIFDSHMHTKYSNDSSSDPYKLMKVAKKVGLTSIAITDHNSVKGAIEAKKYEKEFGIEVIVGVERHTSIGDVIGLFVDENIKSKNYHDVVQEIKDMGGLTVLPHPYRSHTFKHIAEVEKDFDVIEVWNARSDYIQNTILEKQTLDFHDKSSITMGSDAHFYNELGNVKLRYETDIDKFAFIDVIDLKYTRKYNIIRSMITYIWKKNLKL